MKDTRKGPRYSVIPSRAVYDTRLTPRAMRVLCALGVHSDSDGWCFPDQKTIAKDLAMSRARVSGAIVELAEFGYIACELRVQKGKGMRGLWYRVILDTPGKPPIEDATSASGAVTKREHRRRAEQNGETGPVSPNGNTGAGVTKRCEPVLPNGNTGYIVERPNRTRIPLNPPQAGEARARKSKSKRGRRRAVEPREFVEAWELWTKAGSNRTAALKAWREHRASGKRKLGAVRAYLASKQAQAENGRFVPYMQRWLRDSLGSFVEVADKQARERQRWEAEQAARKARGEMAYCADCRTSFYPTTGRCHCPERTLSPSASR